MKVSNRKTEVTDVPRVENTHITKLYIDAYVVTIANS